MVSSLGFHGDKADFLVARWIKDGANTFSITKLTSLAERKEASSSFLSRSFIRTIDPSVEKEEETILTPPLILLTTRSSVSSCFIESLPLSAQDSGCNL